LKCIQHQPKNTADAIKRLEATQESLITHELKVEGEVHPLKTHEIDAITAALTAILHLKNQTEQISDDEENYIIVPKQRNWKNLK
jgi:predicted nuclease with RNAse H fold